MRVLELFSGTGSVGKVFRECGHDVLSLDCDPRSNASVIEDILEWDYTRFSPGGFDVVWASPPCTHYSKARTTAKTPRDLEGSDRIVAKTLEVIRYFNPKWWFMENPQTGLLKSREVVQGLPWSDINYCQYGRMFWKKTRIWHNCPEWQPRPLCKRKTCPAIENGHHKQHAQAFTGTGRIGTASTLAERHTIPRELVEEICTAIGA